MKLRQYFEIQELNNKSNLSKVERYVELVSILTEKDPDELKELPLNILQGMVEGINLKINKGAVEKVTVRNKDLYLIPFNNLTLGEWIDLDYYLKNNLDLKIIEVLYRQKNDNPWDKVEYESYGSFSKERSEFLLELKAEDVLGVKQMYIQWRENVLTQYQGLFQTFDKVEDYSDLDIKAQREIEQALKEEEQMKQFAWERLVMLLCDNDITKFNQVLELPVIQVFNIMAMKKITKK
jgi:hypothetical protein